jgi:RHS repeat-associated protein
MVAVKLKYPGTRKENPHAVTSIGAVALTYDNNGNMLTKGTSYTNTWDYNNRITQTVAGANTVTFKYDPSGQRITYTKGAATTVYPSKFYNFDGTTRQKHIFANGVEIANVTGTGVSAVVRSAATDHLTGSNVTTTSANAQEEVLDYFPFGNVRVDQKAGTYSDQRQYAGSEFDLDSGLNYMNARYYDAAIGRFDSQDPSYLAIGDGRRFAALTNQLLISQLIDPQQLNSYTYARNNPLVYTDPTGNSIISLPWISIPSVEWGVIGTGVAKVAGKALGAIGIAVQLAWPTQLSDATISPAEQYVPGGKFSPKTKQQTEEENKARNDGKLKCDNCGKEVNKQEKKAEKGGKLSPDDLNHDHKTSRKLGGDNSPSNDSVKCRDCNLKKGAQTEEQFKSSPNNPINQK